jgi:two-component system, NarL family, nitrate/nitrite response regulator NarL
MSIETLGEPRIRVFIVGKNRLYREGLALVLGESERIDVVGVAGIAERLTALSEAEADVVLLDASTAENLVAARAILEADRSVRIVALSVSDAGDDVVAFGEAGVCGYVPLEGSVADLVATVESVSRGEAYLPPRAAAKVLERLRSRAADEVGSDLAEPLTVRELEIVELIRGGLSNKEIARQLGIALATVKNHVHNILLKARVSRRLDVAIWATDLAAETAAALL